MINLKCINHDTEHEINNIIHLFEPYMKGEWILESIYQNQQVVAKLINQQTGDMIEQIEVVEQEQSEIKQKKQVKLVLKMTVYQVLQQQTQKTMPWGILTGIRPTKIVHDYLRQGQDVKEIRAHLIGKYKISKEKVQLMIDVALAEEKILEKNKPEEVNIYVGIPFCPTRCVYCSFTAYSIEAKKQYVEQYLDALCKEISFVAEAKKGQPIRSLYIGGGTPTSINAQQLERLLQHIATVFKIDEISEYTIEAGRPDTITKEKLEVMKRMGVGRISINPQSMNQKTLDIIGRHHTVEEIKEVFEIARELGHNNINMDIILGLPGEDVEDVKYTLDELKKLNPENITVHTMAIKRASKLKETQNNYELTEVDKIYEMLKCCEEACSNMALYPYYMYRQKNMLGNFENVGYAKLNHECIYNVEIMEEKQSIIAVGAGAITKLVDCSGEKIERIANVKNLEDYINRIDEMIQRKALAF